MNTPVTDERFAARLAARDNGCIEWTGCRTPKGYGRVRRGSLLTVHRYAWELANGPIPRGLMVLHRCDNPPCVNVEHLRLGTAKENAEDMIAKGRSRQQQKTHCPKGHAYDEANTYVHTRGDSRKNRQCRACGQQHHKAQRARLQADATMKGH